MTTRETMADFVTRKLGTPRWYTRFRPRRGDPDRFISPDEWAQLQEDYRRDDRR